MFQANTRFYLVLTGQTPRSRQIVHVGISAVSRRKEIRVYGLLLRELRTHFRFQSSGRRNCRLPFYLIGLWKQMIYFRLDRSYGTAKL